MPTKRPQLTNGEIYHIVMRGVDGRIIFPQEEDSFHFLHDLYEFNDEDNIDRDFRYNLKNLFPQTKLDLSGTLPDKFPCESGLGELKPGELKNQKNKKRKLLVEILAFCLMPNHFHLLLHQIKDNGISKFMRKLGGYATYINNKYSRQGHLYQGRFKAIHIKDDDQLKNVFVYIHANPLSLVEPNWKKVGIKKPEKSIKFLENYKWSSYLDYIGIKNYPSLVDKTFFVNVFEGEKNCCNYVSDWILFKNNVGQLDSVALE